MNHDRRQSTKLYVAETFAALARGAGVPLEELPEMDAAEFVRRRKIQRAVSDMAERMVIR